jgi:tetratricopeptide (TPR) repeat protein
MSRFPVRLLTLAVLSSALVTAPFLAQISVAGGDPPASDTPPPPKAKKKTSENGSTVTSPTASAGYRAAYTAIYDRGDYAIAIDQLKALGRDDSAPVANLIGYAYRKLGDYKVSQAWYERALKSDPNHVKTWQYYGLWQVEQGNREQAQYHLNRIASLSGTGSEEYRSLASALEKPPGTGLVY